MLAFPEPRDEVEAEGMKVMHAAIEDRNKWLDGVFKTHLPEKIYRAAHYGSKRGQFKAKKWCDRNGVEIREQGMKTEIVIGGKVVGRHEINLVNNEEAQNGN